MQGRPIGRLSGGQKARLGMLVLRLAEPNFYLLDEPTNHLDIEGQEALEAELMDHQASCLAGAQESSPTRRLGVLFVYGEDHPEVPSLVSALTRRTSGSWLD